MFRRLNAIVAAAAVFTGGCVFDADDRCGPGQTYDEVDQVCLCDEGTVLAESGDGCEACGDHEEAEAGVCVCEEDYSRPGEGDDCEKVAAGLGEPCDASADTPCMDEVFAYCADTGDDEGYCTMADCDADGDCPTNYACDQEADPSYCKAPPPGRGSSCEGDEDCAEFDASYCETFFLNMCLVEGCAESGGACHGNWACCDFSDLVGVSLCIPPDQLMDGACPLDVDLVEAE